MYYIILLVSCLALGGALPNNSQRPTLSESSLINDTDALVKSLSEFVNSTSNETNVLVMRRTSINLQKSAARLAKSIEKYHTKLGIHSIFETPEQETTAATNKLKTVLRSLTLTDDALLQLIVGDQGTMGVDHARLTMSLDLLDKVSVSGLQADLNVFKNAETVEEKRRAMGNIKASLDAVFTVLDGIEDIAEDAVITTDRIVRPRKSSWFSWFGGDDSGEDNRRDSDEHDWDNSDESDSDSDSDEYMRGRRTDSRLGQRDRSVRDRRNYRVRRQSGLYLGRGWGVDSSGLNYRSGNFHFNARPTFSGIRPSGAQVSFSWRFKK